LYILIFFFFFFKQKTAYEINSSDWSSDVSCALPIYAAGVAYDHVDETSLYFLGPDGERLELIADPLRWMYGERVD
jgi:hypothetical protein